MMTGCSTDLVLSFEGKQLYTVIISRASALSQLLDKNLCFYQLKNILNQNKIAYIHTNLFPGFLPSTQRGLRTKLCAIRLVKSIIVNYCLFLTVSFLSFST